MADSPTLPLNALAAARQALQAGQPAVAVSCLSQILAGEPNNARAHELMAIAQTQAGNREAARAAFLRSTQCDPRSASAHYNFALFLSDSNDLDEAAEENSAALYLKPDHPGALALQKKLAERIRFRAYTVDEPVALVGTAPTQRLQPSGEWNKLECTCCGAKNHITARTCSRCGNMLPEMDEIIPVE